MCQMEMPSYSEMTTDVDLKVSIAYAVAVLFLQQADNSDCFLLVHPNHSSDDEAVAQHKSRENPKLPPRK